MTDRRQLGIIDRSANTLVLTRAQAWYADWSIDILIYTIVINLFVQYVDAVVIDSFAISLLTAVLLKVMLVLLSKVEEPVSEYFRSKGTAAAKAVGTVAVIAIIFTGKLLVFEIVTLVFGDEVELGSFPQELALIITMIVARELMNRLFDRLGTDDEAAAAS